MKAGTPAIFYPVLNKTNLIKIFFHCLTKGIKTQWFYEDFIKTGVAIPFYFIGDTKGSISKYDSMRRFSFKILQNLHTIQARQHNIQKNQIEPVFME